MANRRIFDLIFRTKGFDKAKGEADGVNTSFDNLAKTAKSAAIGFVSFQTALKSVELAKLAANTETVRRSFGNLAKEPDKMLQAMKKATAGTISEMELMQKFNEASLLGLPLDRFDEMLNIARGAAQSTGQSMDFMLNSIVVALGRGSKLMLDNLGILIDVGSANEKYAESLGKSANKLSDVEKKQAFVNEALRIGNDNLERSGGVVASNIDSFGKFNASIENLSATFGKTLIPAVTGSLNFLSDLADNVSLIFDSINKGVTFFDKFATGVNETAKAYFGLTEEVKTATVELDKFQQMQVFGERIKELEAQKAIIDASVESQQKGVLKSQSFFAALFGELSGANQAARDLFQASGDVEKMGLQITIDKLRLEFEKYGLTLDDVRTTKLKPFIDEKNRYLKAVKVMMDGNETELAYLDSLKGSYSEFIDQQFIQLENKEKEDAFIARFTAAYPKQAKSLGLLTSAQKKQAEGMKNNIQLAGAFASALSNAFDPNQSGAEAFQGFIINVITALQGVIIASGAVAGALSATFIPGMGTAAAIAALVALEAAKAGVRSIRFAQFGMDEMVSQPTLIMAGEAGPERVQVTPATRPSSQGESGGLTLNFNGPVTNKEFIRDTVIPEIQRVQNLGLA